MHDYRNVNFVDLGIMIDSSNIERCDELTVAVISWLIEPLRKALSPDFDDVTFEATACPSKFGPLYATLGVYHESIEYYDGRYQQIEATATRLLNELPLAEFARYLAQADQPWTEMTSSLIHEPTGSELETLTYNLHPAAHTYALDIPELAPACTTPSAHTFAVNMLEWIVGEAHAQLGVAFYDVEWMLTTRPDASGQPYPVIGIYSDRLMPHDARYEALQAICRDLATTTPIIRFLRHMEAHTENWSPLTKALLHPASKGQGVLIQFGLYREPQTFRYLEVEAINHITNGNHEIAVAILHWLITRLRVALGDEIADVHLSVFMMRARFGKKYPVLALHSYTLEYFDARYHLLAQTCDDLLNDLPMMSFVEFLAQANMNWSATTEQLLGG